MSLSSKVYAPAPKVALNWECLECGRLMTRRSAERAVNGAGCPGCGGSDIEPARVPNVIEREYSQASPAAYQRCGF